jgi:hypothetical protein
MKEITIVSEDKVGLLADISYILGSARINIESLSAVTHGNTCIISLSVKDEKRATDILRNNGYSVLESELIVVKIKDEPAQMAQFTKKMVDEKINMIEMRQLSKDGQYDTYAVKVDHASKARRVLAEYLLEKEGQ